MTEQSKNQIQTESTEDGQKMVTADHAKAMADAAVAAERDRIKAAMAGIQAGIEIAEAAARLQRLSAPRRTKPPERDWIDKGLSVMTFGIW